MDKNQHIFFKKNIFTRLDVLEVIDTYNITLFTHKRFHTLMNKLSFATLRFGGTPSN